MLWYETDLTPDEVLRRARFIRVAYSPRSSFIYQNIMYAAAGAVVAKASGMSWEEFVQRRIFAPLGMHATDGTDPRPIVRGRAAGCEWAGDRFENRPALLRAIAFAAGALQSTVEDLARWDGGLAAHALLGEAGCERLWTAVRAGDGTLASHDYGFGWFVDCFHGHRIAYFSRHMNLICPCRNYPSPLHRRIPATRILDDWW